MSTTASLHSGFVSLLTWREITDKEKSNKGIWRWDAPEASQGQTRDVPGTPGTFGPDLYVNQYQRDRMSPGQMGHITGQMGRVHGTDGTHTRGCPAKISLCLLFFFFPHLIGFKSAIKVGLNCFNNQHNSKMRFSEAKIKSISEAEIESTLHLQKQVFFDRRWH